MKLLIILIAFGQMSCSSTKKMMNQPVPEKKIESAAAAAENAAEAVAEAATAMDKMKKIKQDTMTLPYHSIPDYPSDFESGNIMGRMIDGLGYRYYWATQDLRPEDLAYTISEDSRPAKETLDHLHGLTNFIVITARGETHIRPRPEVNLTWEEMRAESLHNLKEAADIFKSMETNKIGDLKIKFKRGENESEMEFWHLLNGPIADALYHVGQIVSYRRASGNPLHSGVNVFMGKTKEN